MQVNKEAELALGGDLVEVLCRSTWAEGFDDELDSINSLDALNNQRIFDFVDSHLNIDKEYDDETNNIGGEKWFMKIDTEFGTIAYITDNYPMFFMLKNDYDKLNNELNK